jgi:hypothetical protein
MSSLRAIRLLNSVEAAITGSAALETALSDSGRLSEFNVLMSMRGQARRMAASTVTVNTLLNCPTALNAIFADTDINNPVIGTAILKKQTAMVLVSSDRNTLNIIMQNPTAASLLKASQWFETYIKAIITNLTPALESGDYATVEELVTNNAAMATILDYSGAVEVIIASPTTMNFVASDLTIMATLVDSSIAINLVTASASTMSIIAGSVNAMDSIVSSSIAMPIVTASAPSMTAIAANADAFTNLLSSSFFDANRKNALANLAGLTPSNYADLNSMIDDAAALTAIVSSAKAVTVLAGSSAALSYLATSDNLGIVLNSAIAMGVLGPNVTAMGAFLGNPDAWVPLFASSTVKGYIVSSTDLVDTVAANSDLITYLSSVAVTKSATGTPDGNATALQVFPGVPAKLLTLTAKEAGIAATSNNYNFGGSLLAGSEAGATLSLSAAGPARVHVAGYSDMTWNLQAIGITAATLPIISYVDMT